MQQIYRSIVLTFFALSSLVSAKAQQDLFDISTIQDIRIYFAQSNWDYLLDSLAAADEDARLMAPLLIINGVSFDSVGVKYKGNSSYSPNRPKNPFSIKLDYIVADQDYDGNTLLKLSNGFKDPALVREAMGYEIANQYMDAPRANYAKVYINDVYHGLYTNVESIKSGFLNEHFYSSDNALFKCDPTMGATNPPGCPTTGGGATFTYINTDTICYQRFYEIESDYGWADLVSAIQVLNNTPANLHQVVDPDRILWMLAFNNVLVNLDSYSGSGHNYYAYKDDNGRFCPILWDLNETFGSFSNAGTGGPMGGLTLAQMQQMDPLLHINNPSRPFIQKLLANPKYKKTYIAHLRTILQEYFNNNQYLTRGQNLQGLIAEAVQSDPNKLYSYANFQANLTANITAGNSTIPGISTLMEARKAYLNSHAELLNVPPAITSVTPGSATVDLGGQVWFSATVSNVNFVKLRYRYNRGGIFQETDMFDDGVHNDGAPGDGVYGAALTPAIAGKTDYYVYAENAVAAYLSPERAEHEFYTLQVIAGDIIAPGAIVVNELLASNEQGATDPEGQFEDWIELYNTTNAELSLEGAFLSDDPDNLDKWAFPAVSIPAGGYLLLWADEDQDQDGLHTNFKLSKSGEYIILSNADGSVIDQVQFGSQETDLSYGRCPNGSGGFVVMNPSPNAANTSCVTGLQANRHTLGMKVFPNPLRAGHILTLELEATMAESQAQVQIVNTLGERLFSIPVNIHAGKQTLGLNAVSDWPSGLYWVQVITSSGFSSVPVFVKD